MKYKQLFSNGLLAALLVLIIADGVVPLCSAVKIVDVDENSSIHVDAFQGGTFRFQVLRFDRSDYWLNVSVVSTPLETIQSSCDGALDETLRCVVTSARCVMTMTISATSVAVAYHCEGVLLNTAVYARSLSGPTWKFTFPRALTLYGIPEHAADLPLRAGHNYKLYNVDAFEYLVNATDALYGAIPFLMAYGPQQSTGVLFLNAAEMTVRILSEGVPSCEWGAETGIADVFFFPGPTPAEVQRQHAAITGPTVFPPYFALGYHQSRWNYVSSRDVFAVNKGFDLHRMPYDTLWLDIEHQDNKKTFTWDTSKFPAPLLLSQELQKSGRRLVTIKDPFVKKDEWYDVYAQGARGDHFVHRPYGDVYEGKCWPGISVWPDFLNQRTRTWYAHFFHNSSYPGSRDIHTWIDMNEPSVFNERRGTMPKENIHVTDDHRKVRHGEIHNAYGFFSLLSVYQGALEASQEERTRDRPNASGTKPSVPLVEMEKRLPIAQPEMRRPFLLTRSFFSGSQRYAAMWTGDNTAKWSHLKNAIPELLSLSISNYAFVGCDVGGFFSNPTEELFVRWMQAGIFFPFYRSHNHFESKRREPWMVSEENQAHMRNALALRYALLPYLYTTFYEAHISGDTIMRPLFYAFPEQPGLREEQSAFLFGPSLLVRPVLDAGATQVLVPFPASSVWYSFSTGSFVSGLAGGEVSFAVDMSTIPLFIRGGHIVAVKRRIRRSSAATRHDPFTLYVALSDQGTSSGTLYVDDGETFQYQSGALSHREFVFSSHGDAFVLRNTESFLTQSRRSTHFFSLNAVEEVFLYGMSAVVKSVLLHNDMNAPIACIFEQHGGVISIRLERRPLVTENWSLYFYY